MYAGDDPVPRTDSMSAFLNESVVMHPTPTFRALAVAWVIGVPVSADHHSLAVWHVGASSIREIIRMIPVSVPLMRLND